jgi:hypothetical protein
MNEVEFVQVLDGVHGDFMDAWNFRKLLQQLEQAYLQLC